MTLTILQIQGGKGYYGAEKHTFMLTERLISKYGYNVIWACEHSASPLFNSLESIGATVCWINLRLKSPRFFFSLFKLVRLVGSRNIDIVHTHLRSADIMGCLVSMLTGIPLVVTLHGAPCDMTRQEDPARRVLRKIHGLLLNNIARKIICISEYTKEVSTRLLHLCSESIAVVPNATEAPKFDEHFKCQKVLREIGISSDNKIIAQIGIGEQKRTRVFLEVAHIISSVRDDVIFLLLGEHKNKCLYEAYARDLGLNGLAVFAGWRNDIPRVLHLIDVLCVTARDEGFGRSLTEAMFCSKPVVAFKNAGPAEIISHLETGFLIPDGDKVTMAQCLIQLLDNPVLARKMGKAGRVRAERLFSVDRFADQTESIIRASI